jgi:hypothetical protein
MFARVVAMDLKPNSVAEFTRTIENEIIPLLRKQKGFKHEITFVAPDGTAAVGISVWDDRENAQAYYRTSYPRVLALLSHVVEGIPEVMNYDVANSTLYQIAARAAAVV